MAAWHHWNILHEFDRQYGAMGGVFKLASQVALERCLIYGENLETFEKILTIERLMYPVIAKQMAAKT